MKGQSPVPVLRIGATDLAKKGAV